MKVEREDQREENFLVTLITTIFGVSLALSIDYAHRHAWFSPGDVLLQIAQAQVPWLSRDFWPTLTFTGLVIFSLCAIYGGWKANWFGTPSRWLFKVFFIGFLPWWIYWIQYFLWYHVVPGLLKV